MELSKYENKGLSGLVNLGNTCFINSCVQILSHTYELNDFLNKENYKKKIKNKYESALLLEWDNLRKILWNENCVVSPGKFIQTIKKISEIKDKDIFTGYSQNDVPEFLLFLIDCFHESLSREIKMTITGVIENETDDIAVKCYEMIKNMYSKEYSEIWNLFYAVHVSVISSLETGKQIGMSPEPYFMIDLPIPPDKKYPSLTDCFDHYVNGEILDGDNAFYDKDSNKYIDISKKIQFWSFPNILVIDLKRFNSRNQKNQILISFPLENLDLSKYVIGYKKDSYVYDLFGVCNHSGGPLGGHYTSFVKNANGKWYHFNDSDVSDVGLADSIVTPKAYCLFYRKKNM